MSILSDIGASIMKSSGIDLNAAQEQLDVAQQQLQLAFETLIAENAIIIAEMALIIVLLWKIRRD